MQTAEMEDLRTRKRSDSCSTETYLRSLPVFVNTDNDMDRPVPGTGPGQLVMRAIQDRRDLGKKLREAGSSAV